MPLALVVVLLLMLARPSLCQDDKDRNVLIFYSCWANHVNVDFNPSTNDVWVQSPLAPGTISYWGKPWWVSQNGRNGKIKDNYKMYFDTPKTPNNELLDWHADLLIEAGVDAIVLDLTNGSQEKIVNGAEAVCRRYEQRFKANIPTPKIVLWVKDQATLQVVENRLYHQFSTRIFFHYLNKKLVCVTPKGSPEGLPTGGIYNNYTVRRMWGLGEVDSWQFKVNNETPPLPFIFNGQPEQMSAAFAAQRTYMIQNGTVLPTAKGRQGGKYFTNYTSAAIDIGPRFLMIHSWNEWSTQNLGNETAPTFTDIWMDEYSADIEPVEGYHGWTYYDLMKDEIAKYKAGGRGVTSKADALNRTMDAMTRKNDTATLTTT